MSLRSVLAAAALALCAAPLAACATPDRTPPLDDFLAGRYGSAREWYEHDLAVDPAAEALDRNEAGLAALIQGDVAAAHRHFEEAFTSMEDLSATGGETLGAMVGAEWTKTWKGDPYERCMNAYYLGVTYWLMGDPDNAAACFKSGVLRDADSEEGEAQSDFALLWFLMGQAQREARHEDRGAAALATAHQLEPSNQWLDPARTPNANVIVAVDIGLGPVKVASGPHGALVRFQKRGYRASFAEVAEGGQRLGRTERAVDVYRQAITRGTKVLDHVNAGKAVFKDAAVIAGTGVLVNSGSRSSDLIGTGLILAGLLLPAEADVRQWATLPGEVQVLAAKLAPGEHRLTIDVRDAGGNRLPELSKEIDVTVREGHTTFAWTRALPPERVAGERRVP